jgi:hypothetical protein
MQTQPFFRRFQIVILALLFCASAQAQNLPVKIQVITPVPPPYSSTELLKRLNEPLLVVSNTGANNQQIALAGKIVASNETSNSSERKNIYSKETVPTEDKAHSFMNKQSLRFEENKGQVYELGTENPAHYVKFSLQNKAAKVFLLNAGLAYQFEHMHYPSDYVHADRTMSHEEREKNEVLRKDIRLETYRMDMKLLGANPNAVISKEGSSADFVNFYNRNVLEVRSFIKVTYHNIYPNIDWVLYTNDEGIKYDFVVRPGGNPKHIKLQITDAEKITLNPDGSLSLINRMGEITEKAPVSFQENQSINTSFSLTANILSFNLSQYNPSKTLTIDPSLIWATYYGGTGVDEATSCATDASGNVYLAGNTRSNASIASGGHQNTRNSVYEAFLVKFNASGTRQWATYYGGTGDDYGVSCATDTMGNVYLAGNTYSDASISSGGHQNARGGGQDAFLVKFNASGTRQWATYYGGTSSDIGYACATDASGNIYLAGSTFSSASIASGGHQNTISTNGDAFLVKFNTSGTRQWATYYGGTSEEWGYCATDASGNVYIAGTTSSNASIASGGHQIARGGSRDAFLVKFNPSGVRQWATYYGGTGDDQSLFCAADVSGNIYLAGRTNSNDSIAFNGHQNIFGRGSLDGFLVKFNTSGVRQWATYYGGLGWDEIRSCATDTLGNVYAAGYTTSNASISSGGHQNSFGEGAYNGFLVKFNASGKRSWATYYGATTHSGQANSCATDSSGNVYLAGLTFSTTSIASGGHQNTYGGSTDAYLAKFNTVNFHYYHQTTGTGCTGDLHDLDCWTTEPNGTGSVATSFTAERQVFNIINSSPSTSAAWTVSGATSIISLGGVAYPDRLLTITANNPITGTINLEQSSASSNSLIISDVTVPTLGALHSTADVTYNAAGNQTILAANYDHLTLGGSGTKTMAGNLNVTGTLLVPSGITLDAATYAVSGTGAVNLQAGATLITANTSYINGFNTTTGA